MRWSQEKGDKAALWKLKKLRVGGLAQNTEVEEFVRTAVGAVEEKKDE